MRRLNFHPAYDGPHAPSPLASTQACLNESWVGPLGLLDNLETVLGLASPPRSRFQRAATLLASLAKSAPSWCHAALHTDPMGTALSLVELRDTLLEQGWQPQASPKWPEQLSTLVQFDAEMQGGTPDRVQSVIDRLSQVAAPACQLILQSPQEHLLSLWGRLVDACVKAGISLEVVSREVPTHHQDAARLFRREPAKLDGSCRILSSTGPLSAADAVAAWLSSSSIDPTSVVVVGADPVLDAAIERYGLPTLGIGAADNSGLMPLATLALAYLWSPIDPDSLLETLNAEPGWIPGSAAMLLRDALQAWPSTTSDAWQAAVTRVLADKGHESAVVRGQLKTFLTDFLTPVTDSRHDSCPLDALSHRLDVLGQWSYQRLGYAIRRRQERVLSPREWVATPSPEHWRCLTQLLDNLRLAITGWPQASISLASLSRLVDASLQPIRAPSRVPQAAGFGSITEPGALTGPVDTVIIWNFTANHVEKPASLPLEPSDADALRDHGISLPDSSSHVQRQLETLSEATALATNQVILVSPVTDPDGQETLAHPLAHLWSAQLDVQGRALDDLVVTDLVKPRDKSEISAAALPETTLQFEGVPTHGWLDRGLSATGVESLLGCSLKWGLEQRGGIRRSEQRFQLNSLPMSLGNLAHHVFAELLRESASVSPQEAAVQAKQIFDDEVRHRDARLDLPQHRQLRWETQEALGNAVAQFWRWMGETGAVPLMIEEPVTASISSDLTLTGRVDAVFALNNRDLVIDFKTTQSQFNLWKSIWNGLSVQLTHYARTLLEHEDWPDTAFYSIPWREFVHPGLDLLNQGELWSAQWDAMEAALTERQAELKRGVLKASPDRPSDTRIREGKASVAPPCDTCALFSVCGRDWSTS